MRQPKPFWKSSHDCYYAKINGKQTRLDPNEKRAYEMWHELRAGIQPLGPDPKLIELISKFLEYSKRHNALRTYEWYRDELKSFYKHVGTIQTSKLRGHHVDRWLSGRFKNTTNGSTLSNAVRPVLRCLNWSVKSGYIDKSPLAAYVKPKPTVRDVDFTPEQYALLLSQIKDQPFRDLVETLWHTGCRPTEVRLVEAKHVKDRRWEWPSNAPGKLAGRVVILDDVAWEITQRLAKANPKGPIFRSRRGNPWTANAVITRFNRLDLGFRVVAYSLRIGFATDCILKGIDLITISQLMGHSDLRMLQRVYSRVNKRSEHLRKALEKRAS